MCKGRYQIKASTFDKRGKLIAIGYNSYTQTHPKQKLLANKVGQDYKECLHAEVSAIIRSRGKKIHKIKIERYDKSGNPKIAKPCPVCELAILEAGISFVEYTIG